MKPTNRSMIPIISLILFYILVSVFNPYGTMLFVFFPIITIPLTVWLIQYPNDIGIEGLFHAAIITTIYLLTKNIQSTLLYIIVVVIPAYTVSSTYKQYKPLPYIILYGGILTVAGMLAYIFIMKYMGIDYEKYFLLSLDQVQNMYMQLIDNAAIEIGKEKLPQIETMKYSIRILIDTIKIIYPALLCILGIVLTTIQVFLLKIVLRIKKINGPSIKQLFSFKLSKTPILILIIAMILTFSQVEMANIWTVFALNIVVLFENLLQLMGIVVMIVLVRKTKIPTIGKAGIYLVMMILYMVYPSIMTMLGCFDTIFNYRQVELIV